MSRSIPSTHAKSTGFTLVEMLVVLAILAFASAVALPRLGPPPDHMRLEAASLDVLAALRATRAAAIARNTEIELIFDVDQRQYSSAIISLQRLPPDIDVRLNIAEPQRKNQSGGGFRFFPDGSSTGGEVTLSLGDDEERICVHWLTGQATHERSC